MKKYNLITITFLLSLFIGVTSCKKDAFEPLPDYGDMPENIRVHHTNPKTGEEYTEEELASLEYNPWEEETYEIDQPINLAVIGSTAPSKIEVLDPNGVVVETIVDFSPQGDEVISAIFTTTLEALGLEPGDNTRIKFRSYYSFDENLAIINTKFKITFKGESKNDPTGFQLVRQSGENQYMPLNDVDGRELQVFESLRHGYSYNGDNQQGVVPDEDNLLDFRKTDDFSLAFWVRSIDDRDDDPEMIADQDWESGGNPGFTIAYKGEDKVYRVVMSDGVGGFINLEPTRGDDFLNGEWVLLAMTYDRDGDLTVYESGVEVARGDISGIGEVNSGNDLHIAQDGTGLYDSFFQGDIAEARIFDWVLSAQEIADMAMEPSFPVLLQRSSGELIALPTVLNNLEGVSTFEGNLKGYDFNDTSIFQSVLIDEEETNYLDFIYASDFSISFWVNSTSGRDDPPMLSYQNWDSGGNPGMTMAYKAGRMEINIGGTDGETSITTDGTNPPRFNDGNWHLITVTMDRDGDFVLYQDGVAVDSRDISGIGTIGGDLPMYIGQDGTGVYGSPGSYEGKIAGIVIYNWVLSEGEVADLLN